MRKKGFWSISRQKWFLDADAYGSRVRYWPWWRSLLSKCFLVQDVEICLLLFVFFISFSLYFSFSLTQWKIFFFVFLSPNTNVAFVSRIQYLNTLYTRIFKACFSVGGGRARASRESPTREGEKNRGTQMRSRCAGNQFHGVWFCKAACWRRLS